MSNIAKREFEILDVPGQGYYKWRVDALAHLKANGLQKTIEFNSNSSEQDKAKAIIFLRHHLHEDLKNEYLMVDEPSELWQSLSERYGRKEQVLLPQALFDWANLRFQDFKSVGEYNSALLRITSQLKLCGQKVTDNDLLEKTYSTMHASNVLLQQQYRERGFKKYSDLISVLLVAEQNNVLLLKNHNLRPVGTSAIPEAHATQGSGQGHWKKNTKFRGKNFNRGQGRQFRGKGKPKGQQRAGLSGSSRSSGKQKITCFKCGIKGHYAKECRTAKHLVELYQASQKNKGNNVEANFVDDDTQTQSVGEGTQSVPNLNVSDFFLDNVESGSNVASF